MFWDVFYNLCLRRGISPNSVCKTIGLSNSMATYWKNGTMPKSDVLIQIADYFNVSTDYLLGRTDDPTVHADHSVKIVNSSNGDNSPFAINTGENSGHDDSDLSRIFNELSPEDKIKVLYEALQLKNKNNED